MAGRGPAPKYRRASRETPHRGEWQPSAGVGWQHGPIPPCPTGLLIASQHAWTVWMRSWFAAHWTPADLPGLRQVIRLYDQVEQGEFRHAGQARIAMDTYGITPKGQQDRRWAAPKSDETASTPTTSPSYGPADLQALMTGGQPAGRQ